MRGPAAVIVVCAMLPPLRKYGIRGECVFAVRPSPLFLPLPTHRASAPVKEGFVVEVEAFCGGVPPLYKFVYAMLPPLRKYGVQGRVRPRRGGRRRSSCRCPRTAPRRP